MNKNGKGPQERGPKTGRGLGNCITPVSNIKNIRPRFGQKRNLESLRR